CVPSPSLPSLFSSFCSRPRKPRRLLPISLDFPLLVATSEQQMRKGPEPLPATPRSHLCPSPLHPLLPLLSVLPTRLVWPRPRRPRDVLRLRMWLWMLQTPQKKRRRQEGDLTTRRSVISGPRFPRRPKLRKSATARKNRLKSPRRKRAAAVRTRRRRLAKRRRRRGRRRKRRKTRYGNPIDHELILPSQGCDCEKNGDEETTETASTTAAPIDESKILFRFRKVAPAPTSSTASAVDDDDEEEGEFQTQSLQVREDGQNDTDEDDDNDDDDVNTTTPEGSTTEAEDTTVTYR
ncbi:hypothetical protein PENTCL1PPCAC_25663, partial [Pristionchus entomophagus]